MTNMTNMNEEYIYKKGEGWILVQNRGKIVRDADGLIIRVEHRVPNDDEIYMCGSPKDTVDTIGDTIKDCWVRRFQTLGYVKAIGRRFYNTDNLFTITIL